MVRLPGNPLLRQLTMTDQNPVVGAKALGQTLDHVNRAMLTASASDGDRQAAAIVTREARQPGFNKAANEIGRAHV